MRQPTTYQQPTNTAQQSNNATQRRQSNDGDWRGNTAKQCKGSGLVVRMRRSTLTEV